MLGSTRTSIMTFLQSATFVALVLLALLFVADGDALHVAGIPLVPATLGLAGLFTVAVALAAIARHHPDLDASSAQAEERLLMTLFECALWALALVYVVRLVEIGRG